MRCEFVSLVRFTQQALQTEENTLHVVDGTPLVLQDVQTDAAGEVDIGVVDGDFEQNGRGSVRVVVGKGKGKTESESFVRSFGRSANGGSPGEEVAIGVREGRDSRRGGKHQLHQLGLEAGEIE